MAALMLIGATALLPQEMLADYLSTGTRLSRPQGGFVLWVELAPGTDTLALHELAHRRGVAFVPGQLFSVSGRYANCLRLNCGYEVDAATEAAIRRLAALVHEAQR